jgi:hypothetical protein
MKMYFVSGVCGVGKSALIPHLRAALPADTYQVLDFDSRGVPDDADRTWRMSESQHWINTAVEAATKGTTLIVCGFIKPEDLEKLSRPDDLNIEIIVLDADADTIRKRLVGRYTKDGVFDGNQRVVGKPVNEFIESNVWYSKEMRTSCSAAGCKIIDTSHLTPEEVAKKVIELL